MRFQGLPRPVACAAIPLHNPERDDMSQRRPAEKGWGQPA